MPDMDVIVKSLRRCSDMTICPDDCYYRKYAPDCVAKLHKDVIALLKDQNELLKQQAELLEEQEAVEPILVREGRNMNYNDYVCPCCDNEVVYEQNYCSECGIPFLWKGGEQDEKKANL